MTQEVNGRRHHYHAETSVLAGTLRLPINREIGPPATASLPQEGGYLTQRADSFSVESVITFRSAYTHVAGNLSLKPGHGWTTLSTTVVEGLNVLDVVTADRIVGQMITEHPLDGYVPSVCFLGTRFENLRICGHKVSLELDLEILGAKPANDASYASDPGVQTRVRSQYGKVLETEGLPEETREHYNRLVPTVGNRERVECSLVHRATGDFPGHSHGHVIYVPEFGKIVLGKVTVTHEDLIRGTETPKKTTVQLTMLDLYMGCAGDGHVPIGGGHTNGTTVP
jgi:hypothetical protein